MELSFNEEESLADIRDSQYQNELPAIKRPRLTGMDKIPLTDFSIQVEKNDFQEEQIQVKLGKPYIDKYGTNPISLLGNDVSFQQDKLRKRFDEQFNYQTKQENLANDAFEVQKQQDLKDRHYNMYMNDIGEENRQIQLNQQQNQQMYTQTEYNNQLENLNNINERQSEANKEHQFQIQDEDQDLKQNQNQVPLQQTIENKVDQLEDFEPADLDEQSYANQNQLNQQEQVEDLSYQNTKDINIQSSILSYQENEQIVNQQQFFQQELNQENQNYFDNNQNFNKQHSNNDNNYNGIQGGGVQSIGQLNLQYEMDLENSNLNHQIQNLDMNSQQQFQQQNSYQQYQFYQQEEEDRKLPEKIKSLKMKILDASTLIKENKKFQLKITSLEDEIRNLKLLNENTIGQEKKYQSELSNKNNEILKYKQEISTLESQLKQSNLKIKQNRNEQKTQNNQIIEELRQKIREMKDEIDKKTKRIIDQGKMIEELKKRVEIIDAQSDSNSVVLKEKEITEYPISTSEKDIKQKLKNSTEVNISLKEKSNYDNKHDQMQPDKKQNLDILSTNSIIKKAQVNEDGGLAVQVNNIKESHQDYENIIKKIKINEEILIDNKQQLDKISKQIDNVNQGVHSQNTSISILISKQDSSLKSQEQSFSQLKTNSSIINQIQSNLLNQKTDQSAITQILESQISILQSQMIIDQEKLLEKMSKQYMNNIEKLMKENFQNLINTQFNQSISRSQNNFEESKVIEQMDDQNEEQQLINNDNQHQIQNEYYTIENNTLELPNVQEIENLQQENEEQEQQKQDMLDQQNEMIDKQSFLNDNLEENAFDLEQDNQQSDNKILSDTNQIIPQSNLNEGQKNIYTLGLEKFNQKNDKQILSNSNHGNLNDFEQDQQSKQSFDTEMNHPQSDKQNLPDINLQNPQENKNYPQSDLQNLSDINPNNSQENIYNIKEEMQIELVQEKSEQQQVQPIINKDDSSQQSQQISKILEKNIKNEMQIQFIQDKNDQIQTLDNKVNSRDLNQKVSKIQKKLIKQEETQIDRKEEKLEVKILQKNQINNEKIKLNTEAQSTLTIKQQHLKKETDPKTQKINEKQKIVQQKEQKQQQPQFKEEKKLRGQQDTQNSQLKQKEILKNQNINPTKQPIEAVKDNDDQLDDGITIKRKPKKQPLSIDDILKRYNYEEQEAKQDQEQYKRNLSQQNNQPIIFAKQQPDKVFENKQSDDYNKNEDDEDENELDFNQLSQLVENKKKKLLEEQSQKQKEIISKQPPAPALVNIKRGLNNLLNNNMTSQIDNEQQSLQISQQSQKNISLLSNQNFIPLPPNQENQKKVQYPTFLNNQNPFTFQFQNLIKPPIKPKQLLNENQLESISSKNTEIIQEVHIRECQVFDENENKSNTEDCEMRNLDTSFTSIYSSSKMVEPQSPSNSSQKSVKSTYQYTTPIIHTNQEQLNSQFLQSIQTKGIKLFLQDELSSLEYSNNYYKIFNSHYEILRSMKNEQLFSLRSILCETVIKDVLLTLKYSQFKECLPAVSVQNDYNIFCQYFLNRDNLPHMEKSYSYLFQKKNIKKKEDMLLAFDPFSCPRRQKFLIIFSLILMYYKLCNLEIKILELLEYSVKGGVNYDFVYIFINTYPQIFLPILEQKVQDNYKRMYQINEKEITKLISMKEMYSYNQNDIRYQLKEVTINSGKEQQKVKPGNQNSEKQKQIKADNNNMSPSEMIRLEAEQGEVLQNNTSGFLQKAPEQQLSFNNLSEYACLIQTLRLIIIIVIFQEYNGSQSYIQKIKIHQLLQLIESFLHLNTEKSKMDEVILKQINQSDVTKRLQEEVLGYKKNYMFFLKTHQNSFEEDMIMNYMLRYYIIFGDLQLQKWMKNQKEIFIHFNFYDFIGSFNLLIEFIKQTNIKLAEKIYLNVLKGYFTNPKYCFTILKTLQIVNIYKLIKIIQNQALTLDIHHNFQKILEGSSNHSIKSNEFQDIDSQIVQNFIS